MTETPPTLTIVIPTDNERERIAEIVTGVFSECERAGSISRSSSWTTTRRAARGSSPTSSRRSTG